MNYLAGGMLRCVGNMKIPSLLSGMMCVLDCIFNFLLIFPSHHYDLSGIHVTIPGAGLGVLGAALGTVAAEAVCAVIMMYYACVRQPEIRIWRTKGSFRPTSGITRKAASISAPMTLEHAVICGAQIAITMIVAPLGVIAIAANAFAVTAESLCYMPGYGIGDAATALTGQSHGADRPGLVRQFGYMAVGLGMTVMSAMGVLMYLFSYEIMAAITPVEAIRELGAEVLRIEAWAEPMFAASIVAYGVFVGVGNTTLPAVMNFGSIWAVRVPLAWLFAKSMGLQALQRSRYKKPEVWSDNPDVPAEKRMFRTPDVYGYFTANWEILPKFRAIFTGTLTGPMTVQHSRTVVTLKNGIPLSIGSVKLTEREHITQIGKESLDKKICLNISESMVKVG